MSHEQAEKLSCQVVSSRATVRSMLICYANTKGGSGKTTLAVHNAVWLHDLGYRVALLDVDFQHLSSHWVRLAEPGITVRVADSPKEVMREIKELTADHDYVIGDGPGGMGKESIALMLQADLVLLPVMSSALDLWSAAAKASELLKKIQENRTKKLDARLIVNGVDRRTRTARKTKDAVKQIAIPATKQRIRRLDAFANVPAEETTVTRQRSRYRNASADIEGLFTELLPQAINRKNMHNKKVGNG